VPWSMARARSDSVIQPVTRPAASITGMRRGGARPSGRERLPARPPPAGHDREGQHLLHRDFEASAPARTTR
jgi:hypothetical protein